MKSFATVVLMAVVASSMAQDSASEKLVQQGGALTGAASQLYGRSFNYAGLPYQNNFGLGFDYGNSPYGGFGNGFGAPFLPSQLLSVGYDYPSYATGSYGGSYNPNYGGLNSYGYANTNAFGAYPPYSASSVYGAAGSYGGYGLQRPVGAYGGYRYSGAGYRAGGYGAGARY